MREAGSFGHGPRRSGGLDRKARIEWLKGRVNGTCRILSNARCLSDVSKPSMAWVLSMTGQIIWSTDQTCLMLPTYPDLEAGSVRKVAV